VSYEKQAWSKYDALKSEEENIENGAVVTDSRMNHMEDGIEVNSNAVENHIANKLNPHFSHQKSSRFRECSKFWFGHRK
jgi:hypothetical protein